MEFGSLGLGSQSQSASNQTGTSSSVQTPTNGTNPENTVTPVESGTASLNDRRQDLLGQDDPQASQENGEAPDAAEDLQLTSRRTTLNFDSEQNRIFLEVVDTSTEEVIEQIPSDKFVEFVANALDTGEDSNLEENEDNSSQDAPPV